MEKVAKVAIAIGKKVVLCVEGEIEKDIEKIFVFRIAHVQVFRSILTAGGYIEVEERYEYDSGFIEQKVQEHFQAQRPHQRIIIPPQKIGEYTNQLRVVVDKEGYHLETFHNDQWKPVASFLLEYVLEDESTRKTLRGYKKKGARFIYLQDTRPSQDPF